MIPVPLIVYEQIPEIFRIFYHPIAVTAYKRT